MEYTSNFAFSFFQYAHLHKAIIINENFDLLDSLLWNNVIISRKEKSPSTTNIVGSMYLVPNNSIYDKWKGQEGNLAIRCSDSDTESLNIDNVDAKNSDAKTNTDAKWHFIKPRQGMSFILVDEKALIFMNNNSWQSVKIITNEIDE